MSLTIAISPASEAFFRREASGAGETVESHLAKKLDQIAGSMSAWEDYVNARREDLKGVELDEDALADVINDEIHAMRAEQSAAGHNK